MIKDSRVIIGYGGSEEQVVNILTNLASSKSDIWAEHIKDQNFEHDSMIRKDIVSVWFIRYKKELQYLGALHFTEMEIGVILSFTNPLNDVWKQIDELIDVICGHMELVEINPIRISSDAEYIPLYLLDISYKGIDFPRYRDLINKHLEYKVTHIRSTFAILRELVLPREILQGLFEKPTVETSEIEQHEIEIDIDAIKPKFGIGRKLTTNEAYEWTKRFRNMYNLGISYPLYYKSLESARITNHEHSISIGKEGNEKKIILDPYPPFAFDTLKGWLKREEFKDRYKQEMLQ